MGRLLARLLVRIASLGAPRLERERFVREWEAELWHEVRRGRGGPAGAALVRHAFGAFADARTLSDVDRRSGEGRSMGAWMTDLAGEVKRAARGLLRSPGFTATAVLTLGLGMGGSAAIYTLLDRVVLDPLPYPHSERLVDVSNQVPGVGSDEVWNMSTAQYVHLSEQARSFERVGLYRGIGGNVQTPEGPRRSFGWRVTAGVFDLIGARARHGRVITRSDDRPGGAAVLVLSHGFWERQFGGDPEAVGRTLTIYGRPFEIVGVLEPGVRMPEGPPETTADFWMPLQIDPEGSFQNNHVFPMIARLAPDTGPEEAEVEIARLTSRLPERFPNVYSPRFFERYGFRTQVTPLKEAVLGDVSRNLWILFGAVGLVLMIAVANVANLFVVRMGDRRRGLAIRSALGADRAALARHLLAESMTLALAGGVLALVVGRWGTPALVSLAPEALPGLDGLGVGPETVVFTLGLSAAAGLALAAYPLLQHTGSADPGALAAGGRSSTAGCGRQRVRSGLVVGQVALALTLVVGAGLLLESMRRLSAVDPGFEPEGVIAARIHLDPTRYENSVELWLAYERMLERIRAIPGVVEAGMSQELPIRDGFGCTVQGFEDAEVHERIEATGRTTCAGQEATTPGYFEAMGIPVIQGRTLTRADLDDPGRGAVVVSRAFAERFWPGEDPIGKGVAPSGRTDPPFHRVVGVVDDVPAGSLDGEPAVAVYYPVVEHPDVRGRWYWSPTSMSLAVKTDRADPLSVLPAVRREIHGVDPTVPLSDVTSMERIVADSTARLSFVSLLLAVAAGAGLLLAAVGLHGVVAYVITRRTREIGMRIAVGADPGSVQRRFVVRSMALVGGGLLLGSGLALATTRLMEGLLYGVEPTDPLAFAGAAGVLGLVGLLASWLPARRASRVDPVEALRAE